MKNECSVRLGHERDCHVLARFNQAMAKETENLVLSSDVVMKGVQGLLKHPEYGFYIVAESSSEVVGCLLVTYEWSDWRNGLIWWIQSVYVTPDYRRQGIYRHLYEQAKTMASQDKRSRGFRLYVEKDNVTAQRTYRKLGMKETQYKVFEELLDR